MDFTSRYDTATLMRVSGLGLRAVLRAVNYGCLVPDVPGGGRGNKTLWAAREVALAMIYADLKSNGLRPSAARRPLSEIRGRFDLYASTPYRALDKPIGLVINVSSYLSRATQQLAEVTP